MLAGFPRATLRDACKEVEHHEGYKVFSAPAPEGGGAPSYGWRYCLLLMRSVAEYSIRRHVQELRRRAQRPERGAEALQPAPAAIHLFYAPAADHDVERLLATFDFFVFPTRLGPNTSQGEWRHDHNESRHAVRSAFEGITSRPTDALRLVRARVPSAQRTALKLPGRNFMERRSESIDSLFREIRSGNGDYEEPDRRVQRGRLRGRRCILDARERYFPHDPTYHGLLRPETDRVERREDDDLRRLMNGLYRFGQPLTDGLHFDVQREGRDLDREEFRCSLRGAVTVSGTHANVYPNDFVRR